MKRIEPIWRNLGPEDRRTLSPMDRRTFRLLLRRSHARDRNNLFEQTATDPDATTRIARLKPASDLTAMSVAPRQQH